MLPASGRDATTVGLAVPLDTSQIGRTCSAMFWEFIGGMGSIGANRFRFGWKDASILSDQRADFTTSGLLRNAARQGQGAHRQWSSHTFVIPIARIFPRTRRIQSGTASLDVFGYKWIAKALQTYATAPPF